MPLLSDIFPDGKQKHEPIAFPIFADGVLLEKHWHNLRRQDVTATSAAVLFGLHPSLDAWTYWHQRAGTLTDDFVDNNFTLWGREHEATIARVVHKLEGWDQQGWQLHKVESYLRHPTVAHLGCTCDYILQRGNQIIALEIKNVGEASWGSVWLDLDQYGQQVNVPPAYIEIQAQTQMDVLGIEGSIIAAHIGGNRHRIFYRHRDMGLCSDLHALVRDFTTREIAPPLDQYKPSLNALKRVFPCTVGSTVDASADAEIKAAFERYFENREIVSKGEAVKLVCKLQLVKRLKTGQHLICGNYQLTRGTGDKILIKERVGKASEVTIMEF